MDSFSSHCVPDVHFSPAVRLQAPRIGAHQAQEPKEAGADNAGVVECVGRGVRVMSRWERKHGRTLGPTVSQQSRFKEPLDPPRPPLTISLYAVLLRISAKLLRAFAHFFPILVALVVLSGSCKMFVALGCFLFFFFSFFFNDIWL